MKFRTVVKRFYPSFCSAVVASSAFMINASAAVEDELGVVTTITDKVDELKGLSAPVISAAIGLGLLFWGVGFMVRKFKSLAK